MDTERGTNELNHPNHSGYNQVPYYCSACWVKISADHDILKYFPYCPQKID